MTGSIFSAPPMDQRLLLAEEILSTMPSDCFHRFHTPAKLGNHPIPVVKATSPGFRRWVHDLLGYHPKA